MGLTKHTCGQVLSRDAHHTPVFLSCFLKHPQDNTQQRFPSYIQQHTAMLKGIWLVLYSQPRPGHISVSYFRCPWQALAASSGEARGSWGLEQPHPADLPLQDLSLKVSVGFPGCIKLVSFP